MVVPGCQALRAVGHPTIRKRRLILQFDGMEIRIKRSRRVVSAGWVVVKRSYLDVKVPGVISLTIDHLQIAQHSKGQGRLPKL